MKRHGIDVRKKFVTAAQDIAAKKEFVENEKKVIAQMRARIRQEEAKPARSRDDKLIARCNNIIKDRQETIEREQIWIKHLQERENWQSSLCGVDFSREYGD